MYPPCLFPLHSFFPVVTKMTKVIPMKMVPSKSLRLQRTESQAMSKVKELFKILDN